MGWYVKSIARWKGEEGGKHFGLGNRTPLILFFYVCSSTGGIQLYHFLTAFVPPTSRLFPVLPCQVILSGAATTKVCFPLHIARLLRVVYVRVEEYCTGNGKQNDVIFLVGMGQRYCLGGTIRHHVHSVSSNQFCEQHRAACMHLFIHERVEISFHFFFAVSMFVVPAFAFLALSNL